MRFISVPKHKAGTLCPRGAHTKANSKLQFVCQRREKSGCFIWQRQFSASMLLPLIIPSLFHAYAHTSFRTELIKFLSSCRSRLSFFQFHLLQFITPEYTMRLSLKTELNHHQGTRLKLLQCNQSQCYMLHKKSSGFHPC